jgi:hypothetical protein
MAFNVPKNKFFASSKEEVQEIVKNHPELLEQGFLLPRADVKTLPMLLYSMRGTQTDLGSFKRKSESTTKVLLKSTKWKNLFNSLPRTSKAGLR